ncbi:MAG: hypothetical protein HFF43_04755 [Lawsonibacter sp.]|jgi:predicted nuclease with TOPRIM domain|nr:hypothetical protein [Lawsonibacter sp.]
MNYMVDMELLKAIEEMMDRKLDEKLEQKLAPIIQRLDRVEGELCEVKEGLAEVRTGVNALLEWGDEVSGTIAFPIPKMNL